MSIFRTPGFVNYFEYLGKLLKSGKAWESFYNQGKLGKAFFHLSTRKGFRSNRKGFVNLFPNLGKLLKILGKVSFRNFPKLTWERKGKGKLSVLPMFFLRWKLGWKSNFEYWKWTVFDRLLAHNSSCCRDVA